MDEHNEDQSIEAIVQAAISADATNLGDLVRNAASFAFLDGNVINSKPLSDFSFDALVGVLRAVEVKRMKGSHELFFFLQSEWQRLTPSHRHTLFEVLQELFGAYVDNLSQYLIAEIFGKYFCNDNALQFLNVAVVRNTEKPAAYAAYGIGLLARRTCDLHLRTSAKKLLDKISVDARALVRAEAKDALGFVGREQANEHERK